VSGDPKIAIDTSFVISILKGTTHSNRPLHEIAFPFAVVGELRFGATGGRDPLKRLAEIDLMVGQGTVLVADSDTARNYAEIRHSLKSRGTPLPENDVWIAATCIQHALPLLTIDKHFDLVTGLALARE
jgi:tRNA(fMet)-specific endonuclease VapC